MIDASAMWTRYGPSRSVHSELRLTSCSQKTAPLGEPGARASASSTPGERAASIGRTVIAPLRSIPSSWRSARRMLTASLATSAVTRSPTGSRAYPGAWTTFVAAGSSMKSRHARSASSGAAITRTCSIARSVRLRPPCCDA